MQSREIRKKHFIRNKEDFVCEDCGWAVEGDGYRNHCPNCLVSKHVDVNPGDRDADCGGIMDVTDIVLDHGKMVFYHTCRKCGMVKKNKAHREDRTDSVVNKMKEINEKKPFA